MSRQHVRIASHSRIDVCGNLEHTLDALQLLCIDHAPKRCSVSARGLRLHISRFNV